MNYPYPKAPRQIGTIPTPAELPVYEGTTPTDLQRIVGAQYATSGILPTGGVAVSGTSSMAYRVTAGAVVLKTAAGLGLLHAIEEQTVNTLPAPSTGSRTDRIVMDVDGAVSVTQGSAPPGGITLGLFTVPAGITATTSAQQSVDRNFAIPAGASLPRLAHWVDPGRRTVSTSVTTVHTARFFLPSDRLVRVDLATVIKSSTGAAGGMRFEVELTHTGGVWEKHMHAAFGAIWDTRSTSFTTALREGTVSMVLRTRGTGGPPWELSEGVSATEVSVWDAGVSR